MPAFVSSDMLLTCQPRNLFWCSCGCQGCNTKGIVRYEKAAICLILNMEIQQMVFTEAPACHLC